MLNNDMKTNKNYQMCQKTVMDTTDPKIEFDEKGICQHYYNFFKEKKIMVVEGKAGEKKASNIINQVKKDGKNKKYDCIIGLSGGVDSSYLAYVVVKKYGLRPLAVHMDNGWNSELAVANIENIIKKLKIDLYTEVLDWEEFREIQKSFFIANVGNIEMITDHAINAVLFRLAQKHKIKHIISGSNYNSEGILQSGGWGHDNRDWTNIKDINNRFGKVKITKLPHLSSIQFLYYTIILKISYIRLLNYIDYNKIDAIKVLENELEWQNYGRKHGESVFTRFFQEYYLPRKFNVDKRKSHLSSLICAGQISRNQALLELEIPLLTDKEEEELKDYVCKKLQFNSEEWSSIMTAHPVPHTNYKCSIVFGLRNNKFYKKLRSYIRKKYSV